MFCRPTLSSLAWFFCDLSLACLSLRILPKCQSSTNLLHHLHSFIVKCIQLLSGWLPPCSVSLIGVTFYGLNLTCVVPRIFVWVWWCTFYSLSARYWLDWVKFFSCCGCKNWQWRLVKEWKYWATQCYRQIALIIHER